MQRTGENGTFMKIDEEIHVLYIAHGRLALSEHKALQNALFGIQQEYAQPEMPALILTLVTSQKAALLAGRSLAPAIAVIEFREWPKRVEFCSQLVQRWPTVRMVAVTNHTLVGAPVDFAQSIPYPMSPDRLGATLKEMLHQNVNGRIVQAGEVMLDLQNRTVFTTNGQYHMTPKQSALLHMLMERADEVVPRSEIMQEIWQTNFLGDTRTLDVHIRWLRERIETDPSNPQYLLTVRGKGYRFCSRR